jgi:hypothetical protein
LLSSVNPEKIYGEKFKIVIKFILQSEECFLAKPTNTIAAPFMGAASYL